MSDGPHRSLPMNKSWKRAAEDSENCNFDPVLIADKIQQAMEHDFLSMLPEELKKHLKESAREQQGELSSARQQGLDALYRATAGSPLATLIVQHLEYSASNSAFPSDAVMEAMENAHQNWLAVRFRQVEEHYSRHPRGSVQAARKVRAALEAAGALVSPHGAIAAALGLSTRARSMATKASGLDELAP